MSNRWEVHRLIDMLPAGNVDDVYRFVAGMYATAEGPATCDCCGRVVEDVSGLPRCGVDLTIGGKLVGCANTGRWWKLTRLKDGPTQDRPQP